MDKIKYWLLAGLLRWFARMSTPARLRAGRCVTWLSMKLARRRQGIVRRNLELCFPEEPPETRERWLREHFRALSQSFVDRGVLWYGSDEAVCDMVRMTGYENIKQQFDAGKPVLLLVPHFIALDATGTRFVLAMREDKPAAATMYTPQRDPMVNEIVNQGRARFSTIHLVSRHDGVRELVRHLRNLVPVYYLPDMDFGAEGAAFVPFFGIPAATLLATARLGQRAAVIPAFGFWDPGTGRYNVEFHPPLPDFPGNDTLEAATARLNRELETWIRRCPSQYYWVHRRFKTRPEGEPSLY